MSHLGSLLGVTFESLLGHFNSLGVSVELGARPLHNPCLDFLFFIKATLKATKDFSVTVEPTKSLEKKEKTPK